jgi:hypothetical protein
MGPKASSARVWLVMGRVYVYIVELVVLAFAFKYSFHTFPFHPGSKITPLLSIGCCLYEHRARSLLGMKIRDLLVGRYVWT